MRSYANPATPDNGPLLKEFVTFSEMLDEMFTQQTHLSKYIVISEHNKMIHRIQSNEQATAHTKTVLAALTIYLANRIMNSDNMSVLFAEIMLELFELNDSYIKYHDTNAINDRYFISVIAFACNVFINTYRRDPCLQYIKYINSARHTLEIFLKHKQNKFDDIALVAKFWHIKLLYIHRILSNTKISDQENPLLNRPTFESMCNSTLAPLKKTTSSRTTLESCFKYALLLYQHNVSIAAMGRLKQGKQNTADHTAVERQVNILTNPELVKMIDDFSASMTDEDMKNHSPKNLKLSLFSLFVEESTRLSSHTEQVLSNLILSNPKSSALLQIKLKHLTWDVNFLSNPLTRACLLQKGFAENLEKLKLELSELKQSVDEICKPTTPAIAAEIADQTHAEESLPVKQKTSKRKKKPNSSLQIIKSELAAAKPTPQSLPPTEKASTPKIKIITDVWLDLPDDVQRIIQALRKSGYKVYMVGGAIRDMLLNKSTTDYDIVTTAPIHIITLLFNHRGNFVGSRFPVFSFNNLSVQISPMVSTYSTSNTEQLVMPDGSMHILYRTDDFQEDAVHRDFTCNSLYFDPEDNCIIDPHTGIDDIKYKMIVFINPILEALQKNPVLIFRAMRLTAKYGMVLSPEDKAMIQQNASLVSRLHPRQLQAEIEKTLEACKDTNTSISIFSDFNVASLLTPSNKITATSSFFAMQTGNPGQDQGRSLSNTGTNLFSESVTPLGKELIVNFSL